MHSIKRTLPMFTRKNAQTSTVQVKASKTYPTPQWNALVLKMKEVIFTGHYSFRYKSHTQE